MNKIRKSTTKTVGYGSGRLSITEIEVEATDIEIFTASQELPFSIEEVRQKDGTLANVSFGFLLHHSSLRFQRTRRNQHETNAHWD